MSEKSCNFVTCQNSLIYQQKSGYRSYKVTKTQDFTKMTRNYQNTKGGDEDGQNEGAKSCRLEK